LFWKIGVAGSALDDRADVNLWRSLDDYLLTFLKGHERNSTIARHKVCVFVSSSGAESLLEFSPKKLAAVEAVSALGRESLS